MTVELA